MRRAISFKHSPLITPETLAAEAFPSRDISHPRWLRRWVRLEDKNGEPHFGIVIGQANPETENTERRTNCRLSVTEFAIIMEVARCATAVEADQFQDLNGYVFVRSHNDALPGSNAMRKAAKASEGTSYQMGPYFRSQGSYLLVKFGVYANRMVPLHGDFGAFRRGSKNRDRLLANAEFFAHNSKGLPDKAMVGPYVENLHNLFALLDANRERREDVENSPPI